MGGSGTPSEVVEIVAKLKNVSEDEQKETPKTRASRFVNQVRFARQYLVWEGLLSSSKRGIRSLTEKGTQTEDISQHAVALEMFERLHMLHSSAKKEKPEASVHGETITTAGDSGPAAKRYPCNNVESSFRSDPARRHGFACFTV